MGPMTYKVHLDGYNNLDLWTSKTDKSARREIFYYDETDLMAVRVDAWKMHIDVKREGSWWNEKYYPSVPYIFNLLMDPMEKMDPESPEGATLVGNSSHPSSGLPPLPARSFRPTCRACRSFRPVRGPIP